MTLSKKDLSTKYDKGLQSDCVVRFSEETYFTAFPKDKHVQFVIQVYVCFVGFGFLFVRLII